jgi:LmbE family N-acetylglucosaminyl deacetylase
VKLKRDTAQIFIPDALPELDALARTTHLSLGAHQDDLEIMSVAGILDCFGHNHRWYSGVVITDGRASPRNGRYADYRDDEMRAVRNKEQVKAAILGEFAALILLDHPSSAVKDGANNDPAHDIEQILKVTRPDIVYTHNLADKHDTHVGVTVKVLAAIRRLPLDERQSDYSGARSGAIWIGWLMRTK